MAAIQPIDEWFGINPVKIQKPTPRTKDQIAAARQKPEKIEYEQTEGITPDEEWFRHYNWRDKRKLVRQALHDADTSQAAMDRFNNCGCCCSVEWNATEKRYRVIGSYCHNRHCEPCMKGKSSLIINNLRASLKDRKARQFRFVTLTLKHDKTTPLRAQIKRLYKAWSDLRKTPLWKTSQDGGVATFEAKWVEPKTYTNAKGEVINSGGGWHPHLHIITEGRFLTQRDLSEQWYAITKDSFMVDVRKMSAEKDVAFYVGKYITKGTNDAVWSDPKRAAEWVKAVKGLRTAATFGNWRGMKLLRRTKEEPGQWTHIASLQSLVRRGQQGDLPALELLAKLTQEQMYDPHRKRKPKPK
jgi:hypothetical protein